jgi:hypothetical protein
MLGAQNSSKSFAEFGVSCNLLLSAVGAPSNIGFGNLPKFPFRQKSPANSGPAFVLSSL